jgi:hypothetical protein
VGISADALSRQIDGFLAARGFRADEAVHDFGANRSLAGTATRPRTMAEPPLDFVCEEDVRQALKAGRTLTLSERAIVTPAARDLGEQHRIFTIAPWQG